MSATPEQVIIVGASNKEDRYSYKAFKMLKEYGHNPIPISPRLSEIEGIKTYSSLSEAPSEIDTVTMYVGAKISDGMAEDLIKLKPKRIIFNPGSENPALASKLKENNIAVIEACTLVMLRTGQF